MICLGNSLESNIRNALCQHTREDPVLADIQYIPRNMHTVLLCFCFVVVMQSFIMNSHEVFIHIHQGCFAGTGAIDRLPQCQWSKPDGYGKISKYITTTKHSKAKNVCIFLGIYCIWVTTSMLVNTFSLPKCATLCRRYTEIVFNLVLKWQQVSFDAMSPSGNIYYNGNYLYVQGYFALTGKHDCDSLFTVIRVISQHTSRALLRGCWVTNVACRL